MFNLNNAIRYLTDAGVSLPEVDRVLAVTRQPARTAAPGHAPSLADRVLSGDLDADQLHAEVAERAQRNAAHREAAQIWQGVLAQLGDGLARALRRQHDEVIKQLRPLFDQAVSIYRAAVAAGLQPGGTVADAEQLGADALAAWARLAEADAIMHRIYLARRTTTGAGLDPQHLVDRKSVTPARSVGVPGSRNAVLVTCLDDLGAGPFAIIAAGLRPRLNTDSEAVAVLRAAETQVPRQATPEELAKERREDQADARLAANAPR